MTVPRSRRSFFGGHASSETFIGESSSKEFAPIAMVNAETGLGKHRRRLCAAYGRRDPQDPPSCGLATPNTDIAVFDGLAKSSNPMSSVKLRTAVSRQTRDTGRSRARPSRSSGETALFCQSAGPRSTRTATSGCSTARRTWSLRGSQNVYCIEVENKLFMHPKVLRAAVVRCPTTSSQNA